MSDVTTVLKEHPLAAGGILVGVIVLAYMQSRASGPQSESYQFRGNVAAGIDPNAAAIEQAAIAAGTANLATIANLEGLKDTNATALTGSLAQTSAARDVQLTQIGAAKDVSLANTFANLKAALFSTEAARDTSLAATAAGVTTQQIRSAVDLQAAQYTADIQRQQINAASTANALHEGTERFAIQSGKDIARAQANTDIFKTLFTGAMAFFGL